MSRWAVTNDDDDDDDDRGGEAATRTSTTSIHTRLRLLLRLADFQQAYDQSTQTLIEVEIKV